MDPLEQILVALVAAIVQAILPTVVQQVQQPSTAQDGFSDSDLQARIKDAINNPRNSAD